MNSELHGVTAARGFRATGVSCGLKSGGKLDLAVIASDRAAAAAAVFTTNLVCGAPVVVSKEHVADGALRAVVVNSGNANACTGPRGEADAREMCRRTAKALGIDEREVAVASTGVIGHPLPMGKIRTGIDNACASLSPTGSSDAAAAIMTTDTVPKAAVRTLDVEGHTVTVGGICKGSGMIAPKLATMLAFLTTDAQVAGTDLQDLLAATAERTFNRVTVDSDTSTSDTVVVLANGASGAPALTPGTAAWELFAEAFAAVAGELARAIAADGEGATKFVTVQVTWAATETDADRVARVVAESPLVKTAIFGGDPNWGRIAAAAGRSGVSFDPHELRIFAGDVLLFSDCQPADYDLKAAEAAFREKAVTITVELGAGEARAEVYTCDLTYDYVRINAEYTT